MVEQKEDRTLDRDSLIETVTYCLENGLCFTVSKKEECNLVREVARKTGFVDFMVQELEKGEEAFFIGPFGTILWGRIVEKTGPVAVWKGNDRNKVSRCCTITSAIYRRIPRDLYDSYKVWARRFCPWPRNSM